MFESTCIETKIKKQRRNQDKKREPEPLSSTKHSSLIFPHHPYPITAER